MRFHISAALMILTMAAPSIGNDFRQSEDRSEFEGWTKDGSLLAYTRTVAYTNLEEIPHSYLLSYAVVEQASDLQAKASYRISGSTNALDNFPDERAAWMQAKEIDWYAYKVQHPFSKPKASPVSPSGRWKVGIGIEGPGVLLSTSTAVLDENLSDRKIPGKVLNFAASGPKWMQENGKWTWSGFVDNGTKRIEFHSENLISTAAVSGGSLSGAVDGYLAAYWSPKEDSVIIEWAEWPVVGGNPESVALFQVKLPK